MKNFFLLGILIIFLISCSSNSESIDSQNISGDLSKWTIKKFNSDNELISKQEHLISNNKITNYIFYDNDDFETVFTETTFIYENNKLIKTISVNSPTSNLDNSETNFIYDDNENLIEFNSHFFGTDFFYKTTFEYNNNIVILTRWRSNDGGVIYNLIDSNPIIRLTFDQDDNLLSSIYGTDSSNSNLDYIYDSNNNLINVFKYPSTEINFTYTNLQNPISLIFINTYGKKGFSTVYLPDSLLFWRNISPSLISTLEGENIGNYTIENTTNSGLVIDMRILVDNFSDGTIDSITVNEFEYQ